MRRLARRAVIAVIAVPAVAVGVHWAAETARGAGTMSAPAAAAATAGTAGTVILAHRHGWTPRGLSGTVPAAGSCHYRRASDGALLADPRCTPGATDPSVTQTNLRSTICRPGGYTASIRPPRALTEPVKRELMAAYGIASSQAWHYQLDHLIELNAGGASDVRNLWPEPNTFLTGATAPSAYVHNDKDQVEGYTFHAICTGKAALAGVQQAIAHDWSTAVTVLQLPPIPKGYLP